MGPPNKTPASKAQPDEFTTPPSYAQTFPPGFSASDHSWLFQSTMEMQKCIGQMDEKINGLRADVKAQGEKLATAEKVFYAVSVVMGIALAIGAFLLNKLWDPLMHMLIAYAKSH